MDQRNILDHQFVAAAYTVTWIIQLGYLSWPEMAQREAQSRAEVARNALIQSRVRIGRNLRISPFAVHFRVRIQ